MTLISVGYLRRATMSRRLPGFTEEPDSQFVSADTLLARALQHEATKASNIAESAQIGTSYDDVLHKCSYTVDVDGTVSCKGCGKGTAKKISHKKGKKHSKSTKSL